MRLQIKEERVIGIRQQHAVFLRITEHRHSHTVNVITETALYVLIGVSRLHRIDGSHQSGMLIDGIPVDHNISHDGTEFRVATRFQPVTDTSVVQIADCQFLILDEQRHQLMDIVCHQITLRIDNKRLVFQEGRRDIHLRTLPLKPFLYLIISPTINRIHRRQTLYNHLHSVRQLIQMRQSAFILLAHHHALIAAHGITVKPERQQRDTQ